MARKKRATDAEVMAFLEAVFPGGGALAAAAFDEAHTLRTATAQLTVARQALWDITHPMARLRRNAEAKGYVLSGMAGMVADDPGTLRSWAVDALNVVGDPATEEE